MSNDLKPFKQCVSAVKKANMTLGIIKRQIVSMDKYTIVRLLFINVTNFIGSGL